MFKCPILQNKENKINRKINMIDDKIQQLVDNNKKVNEIKKK